MIWLKIDLGEMINQGYLLSSECSSFSYKFFLLENVGMFTALSYLVSGFCFLLLHGLCVTLWVTTCPVFDYSESSKISSAATIAVTPRATSGLTGYDVSSKT